MPTPATAKLPPPRSPDEFEEICLDALRLHWGDRNVVRYGRNGQAQQGVDIYSPATREAAQCKNKKRLTLREAQTELRKAQGFHHRLNSLTFMVAGPRDKATQAMIDGLSQQSQQSGGCAVYVLFWDDIVQLVVGSPALVHKHWPTLAASQPGRRTESLEEWRVREFGQLDKLAPYRDPDWWVERRHAEQGVVRVYDFMRVRVYSPWLRRKAFEPEEEDKFAEVIGRAWSTETPAVVTTREPEVIVEQGGPEAALHRRWGWDCRGCLGFVTTLRDAYEPSSFPVPDLSWDVEDLFRLVGGMLEDAEVFVVFELSVYDLMPSWCPSDRRVSTPIRGLRGEASRPSEWERRSQRPAVAHVSALPHTPAEVAAELVATALKDVFKVRLSKKEFAESLATLREQVRRAQMR